MYDLLKLPNTVQYSALALQNDEAHRIKNRLQI